MEISESLAELREEQWEEVKREGNGHPSTCERKKRLGYEVGDREGG